MKYKVNYDVENKVFSRNGKVFDLDIPLVRVITEFSDGCSFYCLVELDNRTEFVTISFKKDDSIVISSNSAVNGGA